MIAAVALIWMIQSSVDHQSCLEQFPYRAPHSARYYFNKFDTVFANVANHRNLDPKLLKSIAWCETRLDPCSVSSVGARGIMQFMPDTFALVSKAAQAENPFDPIDSIESAGVYLAALSNYWQGDVAAIVASYNAGPGNVVKARKRGASIPNIAETQGYVRCVLSAYDQLAVQAAVSDPVSVYRVSDQATLHQPKLVNALLNFFLGELTLK